MVVVGKMPRQGPANVEATGSTAAACQAGGCVTTMWRRRIGPITCSPPLAPPNPTMSRLSGILEVVRSEKKSSFGDLCDDFAQ
jgi:hypothetical protein